MLRRIIHNLIPLIRSGAGDHSDEWAFADVEDFVGDARFDIDKVSGFVFDGMLQIRPKSWRTRPERINSITSKPS